MPDFIERIKQDACFEYQAHWANIIDVMTSPMDQTVRTPEQEKQHQQKLITDGQKREEKAALICYPEKAEQKRQEEILLKSCRNNSFDRPAALQELSKRTLEQVMEGNIKDEARNTSEPGPFGPVKIETRIDGKSIQKLDISYNPDGKIENIKYGDGKELLRDGKGGYTVVDRQNHVTTQWSHYADVSIAPRGDSISYKFDDGYTKTERYDGSYTISKGEQLLAVSYNNGANSMFNYDEQGNLTKVRMPDGSEWTSNNPVKPGQETTWEKTLAMGDKCNDVRLVESFKGIFDLNKADGSVNFKDTLSHKGVELLSNGSVKRYTFR